MIIAAAGSAAAGDTNLGTIELPQRDSGSWLIHKIFAQVVEATATAAESVGGDIRLSPAQGEVSPNPAPSRFPVFNSGSSLGATIGVQPCPLHLYDIEYAASGQARIDLIYNNAIAATVAPQVVAGIMFGDERPVQVPFNFVDRVRTTVTAAADTAVGTITLSQNATAIVGILGIIQQDGVLVAGEELIGFFRLASDDVKLVPAQYPFNSVFSAGLGATIQGGTQSPIHFLPTLIPVPKGCRIDCFCDLNTAVTNGADVEIFIAYI
jgi:hypothetical protein